MTECLTCEKFTWDKGQRGLIEQCWQGWVSKSRLGMDPQRGDWLSQPQMEDGAHRKRINCLISARWGTGLLLADRLLRVKGGRRGGGRWEQKRRKTSQEGTGNRWISICVQRRAGIAARKQAKTTTEVQLWSHTSCGFTSPKERLSASFDVSPFHRGWGSTHFCDNELGWVASIRCFRNGDQHRSCSSSSSRTVFIQSIKNENEQMIMAITDWSAEIWVTTSDWWFAAMCCQSYTVVIHSRINVICWLISASLEMNPHTRFGQVAG